MLAFKSLIISAVISSAYALTSSLQQITANFGANPTNVQINALLHRYRTSLAQLADQRGFIVIYPNAPTSGGCWDVHSTGTLTHNGGGDSLGIANVVRYAISSWGVDATRVFATGTSSGAMMTNVLVGAYPDLFQAGSLYSGVPYGCFAGTSAWSNQCADGQLIQTAQQWGDLVRSGYPGYTGPRPKVQFWHGTADTTLYPQNFWEEIKQWTNVFGVSATPVTNTTNDPQAGYSRASFGLNVQAILAQGVGHTVPEHETDTLNWFGLSALVPGGSLPPVSSTTTVPPITTITPTTTIPITTVTPPATTPAVTPTTTPTTSPPAPSQTATSAHWGQCAGIGWTGPTVCAAPYTCKYSNPYYSQCL